MSQPAPEAKSEPGGTGPDSSSVLWQVLKTLVHEIFGDHVLMVSAGLAYYGLFGLLPALAAAAALWGQVGDLGVLQRSADRSQGLLPPGMMQMLDQFLTSVPEGFGGGFGLVINLLLVVWTSYRAAGGLLTVLNIVYDVTETRGRVRRAAVALAVGVSGILLLFAAFALIALPPLLAPRLPGFGPLLRWVRWPALGVAFTLGLAALFRYAPARDRAGWRWVVCGAVAAALLWIAASAGVSLYVGHLGAFGRLYGSLGGVAVVLLWFYASALAMLAGAEIDAVLSARAEGKTPGSQFVADLRRRERAT